MKRRHPAWPIQRDMYLKINDLKLGTDAAMTAIQADSLAALENFR
jgi:hypothetical protein